MGIKINIIIIKLALIIILTQLIGCTAMIHNVVVNHNPSYDAVEKSWQPIPNMMGRIVVYWPRLPYAGFSLGPVGGFSVMNVTIDNQKTTSIGDQTFIFTDLTPGTHLIEFGQGGLFSKKIPLSVEIQHKEITFVEIQTTQFSNKPACIVNSSKAHEALKEIHHNYSSSVPFDDVNCGRPAF